MIAVLIYVFHTEVWDEIYPLLLPLKEYIKIDIALYRDNNNLKIEQDLKNFHLIKIRYVENRGADIGPFLLQLQDLDQEEYPYFIKLHSKKSIINKFEWKYILFNCLIGSKDILLKNIETLNKDKMIGAITDKTTIMKIVGKNKEQIALLSRLLNLKTTDKTFMAGSMFMSRTKIFKKYFTDELVSIIYPLLETGKVKDDQKGTICHALERIFGRIVSNERLLISFVKTEPYFKIYNKEHKSQYSIYKCYNNYCYTKSNKGLVFGYIYSILQDDSIVVNWTYLKEYDNYFKRYDKQNNGVFIGVS
jgi:lipopolysaccharide biosynthesis protein